MLKKLRNDIESMDKFHQINIFKILKENNITYSENNNGIFINMSKLDEEIIQKLKDYLLHWRLMKTLRNNIKISFFNIL